MEALPQGSAQVVDVIAAIRAGVDLLLCAPDQDRLARIEGAVELGARRRLFDDGELRASAARLATLRARLATAPRPGLEVVGLGGPPGARPRGRGALDRPRPRPRRPAAAPPRARRPAARRDAGPARAHARRHLRVRRARPRGSAPRALAGRRRGRHVAPPDRRRDRGRRGPGRRRRGRGRRGRSWRPPTRPRPGSWRRCSPRAGRSSPSPSAPRGTSRRTRPRAPTSPRGGSSRRRSGPSRRACSARSRSAAACPSGYRLPYEPRVRDPGAAARSSPGCSSGPPTSAAIAASIAERDVEHVVIAARGTSDHAAIYAQYLFGIRLGLPVGLTTPSVLSLYGAEPRFGRALVIGISQSGASPDIVGVVAAARRQGAPTLAITNEPGSALAAAAEHVLDLGAGPELAVAATKTYTAELLGLAILAAAIRRHGRPARRGPGARARAGCRRGGPRHRARGRGDRRRARVP